MLFSTAVRAHEKRKQGLKAVHESETRAALDRVPQLANVLVDLANADVSRIYELQLEIEQEARAVRGEVAALERRLQEVAAAVRQLTDGLKLLGDFENYVLVLGEKAVVGPTPAPGGASPGRGAVSGWVGVHRHTQTQTDRRTDGQTDFPCLMDAAAVRRIVESVRAQARRSAAVRRAAGRLSYDLIVVLCGLRPAFLLDYAPVPLEAVMAVAEAASVATSSPVAVLTLAGCHLVGRLDRLLGHVRELQVHLRRLLGAPQPPPEPQQQQPQQLQPQRQPQQQTRSLCGDGESPQREEAVEQQQQQQRGEAAAGIAVRDDELQQVAGSSPHARLVPPEEAQAVATQLDPLRKALEAVAAAAAAATTEAEAHHLLLDELPDLPLQPTLQGLLLGYPLVYDVRSREEAAAASRCLATQGLVLYRLVAPAAGDLAAMMFGDDVGVSAATGSRGTPPGSAGDRCGAIGAIGSAGGQKLKAWGQPHQHQHQHQGRSSVQMPERDMETLCGFSVPRSLAGEPQVAAAVRGWYAQLAARLASVGSACSGGAGAGGTASPFPYLAR
ncbi:hypothetical protein VOLCADRAFT_92743 [Volvox carteri f. nagariensis]|uniref:Biogenesis of lysosome-related organelles complex 1 subunit 1 n=1 Tax=Volvox carteri f. nagariensis TaxID=3068 RepID=D8U0E8_VOLCA|nr:uncharacterized protein VOLCADRAFT_92743 [Volvox carteri f. nagariensis]EFJ46847.1 hypothetical protein VOLCADRAFT_92743 [Volvox carteri f. nagariensis]|eukprot:XP_002952056.1 hypothetical protein VOLCADRAFT_92743 [Volvox carteri f. nagariensis]